jgi:hypothetical protein
MAANLTTMTTALEDFLYHDPDANPGALLKTLMDQVMVYLIPLAAQSKGVEFMGKTWRVRADGTRLELFEGEELLFGLGAQPPPDLVVPEKRGIILPGRG